MIEKFEFSCASVQPLYLILCILLSCPKGVGRQRVLLMDTYMAVNERQWWIKLLFPHLWVNGAASVNHSGLRLWEHLKYLPIGGVWITGHSISALFVSIFLYQL